MCSWKGSEVPEGFGRARSGGKRRLLAVEREGIFTDLMVS
jgi:hypothetical protein